ncbi:hypothetical protein LX32DRAFT_726872 [Colletotrichum zoysiae]|uniref:Uncharacterized protein n=1 Tax=Colletotrichum zoysiae TaxID=1216348 RepID=A0AAD9HL50_9PEZI|nr:hypothetical protein LX32DRAFT_726872 [Colletotrichum zoysiae]
MRPKRRPLLGAPPLGLCATALTGDSSFPTLIRYFATFLNTNKGPGQGKPNHRISVQSPPRRCDTYTTLTNLAHGEAAPQGPPRAPRQSSSKHGFAVNCRCRTRLDCSRKARERLTKPRGGVPTQPTPMEPVESIQGTP